MKNFTQIVAVIGLFFFVSFIESAQEVKFSKYRAANHVDKGMDIQIKYPVYDTVANGLNYFKTVANSAIDSGINTGKSTVNSIKNVANSTFKYGKQAAESLGANINFILDPDAITDAYATGDEFPVAVNLPAIGQSFAPRFSRPYQEDQNIVTGEQDSELPDLILTRPIVNQQQKQLNMLKEELVGEQEILQEEQERAAMSGQDYRVQLVKSFGKPAVKIMQEEQFQDIDKRFMNKIRLSYQAEFNDIMERPGEEQSAHLKILLTKVANDLGIPVRVQNSPEYKQTEQEAVNIAKSKRFSFTNVLTFFVEQIQKVIEYFFTSNIGISKNKNKTILIKDNDADLDNISGEIYDWLGEENAGNSPKIIQPKIDIFNIAEQNLMASEDRNILTKNNKVNQKTLSNDALKKSQIMDNSTVEINQEQISVDSSQDEVPTEKKLQQRVVVPLQNNKKSDKSELSDHDRAVQNEIANILVKFVDLKNAQHASAYLDRMENIIKENRDVQFSDKRLISLLEILNQSRDYLDFSSWWSSARNTTYWLSKMQDPIVNKSARIMINILNSNLKTKILAPDKTEWKVSDIDFLSIIKIKGNPALMKS